MKKGILFSVFAALMLCFVGCSKDDEKTNTNNGNGNDNTNYSQMIIGSWHIIDVTINGEPSEHGNMNLVFNAGGSGMFVDNGVTENNEFTWSISGNVVTVNPRRGTFVATIVSMTQGECTFKSNTVPGSGEDLGEVIIRMKKENPVNPQPEPENNLMGTTWECSDTFGEQGFLVSISGNITFQDTTGVVELEAVTTYNGEPYGEPMNVYSDFTYTYNSNARIGTMTYIDEESGETESTTFTVNEQGNRLEFSFEDWTLTFLRQNP